MYPNAALQTGTVVGVRQETLPASRPKVGQTVFNVPHALLTKLHKGFKVLVLTVVTNKIKIAMNILNYPRDQPKMNTTCVIAHSAGTWATPWMSAASVVSVRPLSIHRNDNMESSNKNITKLDPYHYVEKMMRLWKFV